jgi:hypothetical protein
MDVAAYLSNHGLDIDTLAKEGVEIDRPDQDIAKERLGAALPEETETVLWFPLSDGGWLALRIPGEQECCGSDHYPSVYIPAFTQAQADLPIYIVVGPLAALRQVQHGRAAVAVNRNWAVSVANDQERQLRDDLTRLVYRRQVRIVSKTDIGVRERQQLVQMYFLLVAATADVEICWINDGNETEPKPFLDILSRTAVDLSIVKEELGHTRFPDYSIFTQTCRIVGQQIGVPTYELKGLKPRPECIIKQEELKPWPEEVDGAELLDEVCGLIREHIWMKPEQAVAITLWLAASYIIDRLRIFPFLFITSPLLGCGKSELCFVVERLAQDGLITTDMSAPFLYNTADAYMKRTLIIDEAKNFFELDRRQHRIINGSYIRASAKVHLMRRGQPVEINSWGPKVLSLIGDLPPDTASRCIKINMVVKPADLEVAALEDTPPEKWIEIRRKMLRWTLDNEFPMTRNREGQSDPCSISTPRRLAIPQSRSWPVDVNRSRPKTSPDPFAQWGDGENGHYRDEGSDWDSDQEKRDTNKRPLRPMLSWIDYGEREVDTSLYHMGDGFLEIGGISMLIGQSYVGKSTFITQWSIHAALGKDWLFFKFHRPLKILIVQAEDPQNKLVKMGQMYRRMGLTKDEIDLARINTRVLTVRGLTGREAIAEMERHVEVVKPDVVVMNPLSSFCPSVYKDEEINHFLRVLFTGMLDRQSCSGIVLAHPPKPIFEKEPREVTQFELQYGAAGMAAITNVARSNMFLTHVNDDIFRLTVGKGFDDLGTPESAADLRRSKDENGIMLWEQCESEEAEEANEKQTQRKSRKQQGKVAKYEDLLKKFKPTDKFSKEKMYELSPRGRDWTNDALKELEGSSRLMSFS